MYSVTTPLVVVVTVESTAEVTCVVSLPFESVDTVVISDVTQLMHLASTSEVEPEAEAEVVDSDVEVDAVSEMEVDVDSVDVEWEVVTTEVLLVLVVLLVPLLEN